jgi:hypothetical protein
MKSLMLLNARKRRKTRRSRRARPNARRRYRRNAMVGSTAASRANFPASMGKKSSRRRRTLRIKRFSLPSGQAGLSVRARKIYVTRRGRKSALIVARNPRRRRTRRNSYRMNPLGGNILSQVKGVFSKENLTIAGGGVAATLLTNYLLGMKRKQKDDKGVETEVSFLPMGKTPESTKMIRIAYAVGIPVLGAILTRKASPGLAKGMVFGALINGIVEGIKGYADEKTKTTFGLNEYLEYTPMSALNGTPGYSAINQFSNVRPMNSAFSNSSAFPADAWGR